MDNLIKYLDKIGYSDICCSFTPLSPRIEQWQQIGQIIKTPNLKKFYYLLLLNYPIHKNNFNSKESTLLKPFIECAVISENGSYYQTNKLSLYISMGRWFFFETPNVNPTIYYGDDSFALLSRLTSIRSKHTLDLCSGPGIQSLISAWHAEKVTSVEINPFSASVAEVNKALNKVDNWQILVGDLYDPVSRDEKFDVIIANPPLLPFPDTEFYPFVGHGGNDGWDVTRRILKELKHFLSIDGVAKIIGTTLGKESIPVVFEELSGWCKNHQMDCIFTITSKIPLSKDSAFFKGLVYTASSANKRNADDIAAAFEKLIDEKNTGFLLSHYLTISHGKGELQLIELCDHNSINNLWFI